MGYTCGIKWDHDLVKSYCENLGYELISKEYLNSKQILILKDWEGYFLSSNSINLRKGETPSKFHKSNPYTIQNIKLWCKLNKKSFELISNKYNTNSKNLQWKCLKDGCGEVFDANWGNIQQGCGCPFCSGHKAGLSNCLATKNPELASEWHPSKNGKFTPYDVNERSGKSVWWQCKNDHKHEWPAIILNRTKNGSNCPYCSGRFPTEENNLLVINPKLCEEWDYNKNKKIPSDYTPGSGQFVWWKCKECGHEWKAQINNRNNGNGCPECAESHGEIKIREWLKNNNISYISQKTFDDLLGLGNGLLSYDFYLPKYNLLIEYQGEQHERYIPGLHKSKKDFEKQQEHDRRKREYAQNNNIRLLEIWYYDFDNIETILEKELLNNGNI